MFSISLSLPRQQLKKELTIFSHHRQAPAPIFLILSKLPIADTLTTVQKCKGQPGAVGYASNHSYLED